MLEHLDPVPRNPERVVVLGGSGFIGSAILSALRKHAIPALALSRREVDLLAPDAAEALAAQLRPRDAVVAAAAIAPAGTLAEVQLNLTLLQAVIGAFERVAPDYVLNIGSDAVFTDLPVPLDEASPKAPSSFHGLMHVARELALAQGPWPLGTLRPTLVYGFADPHNGYGPNRFRRLAQAGEDITLFGEGEERRDHVFVADVAELAVRMLRHRSRGSLNAATGMVWSFREVASMVAAREERPVRILGSRRTGPMPHNGYRPFDVAATRAAFPDFAYTPLPAGLALARLPDTGDTDA